VAYRPLFQPELQIQIDAGNSRGARQRREENKQWHLPATREEIEMGLAKVASSGPGWRRLANHTGAGINQKRVGTHTANRLVHRLVVPHQD